MSKRCVSLLSRGFLLCLIPFVPAEGAVVPVINAITNSASFALTPVAPGSVASIFGTNLAAATVPAPSAPFSTNLGNVTVTVGATLAPLAFVSSGQINFQIPYETTTGGTVPVVVSRNGINSSPFPLQIAATAPGIFTVGGTGTGAAIALNNPSQTQNTAGNPAPAASVVSVLFTGVGAVTPSVSDGASASASPASAANAAASATVGGIAATVSFIGLEPASGFSILTGNVGIAEANIQIPGSLTPGNYPVIITVGGVASQAVTLFVGTPGSGINITSGPNYGTWSVGDVQTPLTATGGTPPYTWTISGGSLLSAGLDIRTDTPAYFPAGSAGIIGVATLPTPGGSNFEIKVTDSASNSFSQFANLTVTGLTITDPYNLPDGFTNVNYSWALNAANSTGGVTWAVANGSNLPAGLTLNAGVISGIPTANGFFNFTLSAKDSTGTIFRGYNLAIYGPGFFTPAALGNVKTGSLITPIPITGQGGTQPYTFSGQSPVSGLSLSANGEITGTPTCCNTGSYFFFVTITDSLGLTYSRNFVLNVLDADGNGNLPQMTEPTPPISDATIGEFQSYGNFGVYGGKQPFAWSATGLPAGMYLITSTQNPQLGDAVQIGGAALALGINQVVVSATDSSSPPITVQRTFTFKVKAMDNQFPPNPVRGTPYSFYLRPIGGTAPFTWAMIGGALPSGLGLNNSTGIISGTPLENGNFNATFTITSSVASGGLQITRNIGFNVNSGTSPQLQINTSSPLADALVGASYNFNLNACCATGTMSWSVTNGSLPTGLQLDPATGLIHGTPTAPQGVVTFTVQATDSVNTPTNFGTRVLTINVAPFVLNTPTPNALAGTPYTTTFTVSGGTGPYTWALAPGSQPLPPSITLSTVNSGGVLFGTPAATDVGGYGFNFIVRDSAAHTFIGFAFLNVFPQSGPPLEMSSGESAGSVSLGTITTGTQQYGLGANGGTGTYTWNLVSGALPPGLALRPDTPNFFAANQQAGLIGVATTPGNYNFTLSVTSGGQTVNQAFTLRVTGLNVQDFDFPDAFVNTAFAHTFTALNNANAVLFLPVTNGVPAGMTLSNAGLLSGSPTTAGFFNVRFTMSDGVDTVTRSIGLNIYAVDITSPGALPNATQNSAYTTTLTASGGTGGYTFAVTNGSLPPGLGLNGATISGTPTTNTGPGIYWFNITTTDSTNESYTKTMTIDVVGTPQQPVRISVGNIDDAVVGDGYSMQISTCCGGVAPFTWSATGLPAGLAIRSGSGVTSSYIGPGWAEIWGVAQTSNTYPVQVTVTDANGVTATLAFPLHVSVLDHNPGLPNGTLGVAYASGLRILGGVGPYSVSQLGGVLPAGITFTPADLNISNQTVAGTPVENGGFNATFQYGDSGGNTLKRTDNFFIGNAAPANVQINDFYDLGFVNVGSNYGRQFSACCAQSQSYAWKVAAGSTLPPGLSLSPGGVLSGTATTAGKYTFALSAADTTNLANIGYRQFKLVVTPISITTNSLIFGNLATAYSATLNATGGTGGLTWSLTFGNYLPPGLSLSAAGVITGTPAALGRTGFSVIVTDANNNTASRFYTIDVLPTGIAPQLAISNDANLGTFTTGTFQLGLGATGGTNTYTWALVSGTLPTGVALRPDTPSFFGPNQQAGLIGVATTPGNYAFTLSVSSGGGAITVQNVQQAFTMRVTALTTKDVGLPDAFVGVPFSYTFTPLNGAAAVTFANGNLPPGMSLSAAGVLSGTPSGTGFQNLNFTITDGTDTVTRFFQLPVYAVDITTPGVLPNGTQNVNGTQIPYPGATIVATGGAGGYTFRITSGGLPPGLTMSLGGVISAGVITGGPGKYQFSVQATDSNNASYSKQMSIDVIGVPAAEPRLNFTNVDDAVVGDTYSWGIDVCCGGAAPFTWSATGLPAGISIRSGSGIASSYLGAGDGELWGVAQVPGNYPVQITVTDNNGVATTDTFTFHVSVLDQTPGLPNGTSGNPYNSALRVIGGTGPYTATAVAGVGALPGGLTFNGGALTVSGTPVETGFFRPVYLYLDAANNTLQRGDGFSITDVPSTTININNGEDLGQVGVGSNYSLQLTANGAASFVWALVSGTPPAGITLSASGLLSGSATGPGTSVFVISAADASNGTNIAFRQFQLVATTTPLGITTNSLPIGNLTTAYGPVTLTATGGNSSPLTWSLAADNFLPQGLSLSAGGVISGTPTSLGQYFFSVSVTDGSDIASRGYVINVYGAGQFAPLGISVGPSLGTSTIGEIQFALGASGGNGVYTWTLTTGSLPTGISLRADTPSFFNAVTQQAGLIGVATAPGTYNFTLKATSGDGQSVTQATTWKITGLTVKDVNSLTDAFVNAPYSYTFTALNNAGAVTFTPKSGVPPGMTLSAGGLLSGTPTTAGFYNVNFSITDGVDTVSRSYGIYVSQVSIVIPNSLGIGVLPNGTQFAVYNQILTASGGTAPYTFTTQGNLPTGLTLSAAGTISGTITSGPSFYSVLITAADANNVPYTQRMSLDVLGSPKTLPHLSTYGNFDTGTFGNQYRWGIAVGSGGTAPFNWTATGLPAGLSIRKTTGSITGGSPGFLSNNAIPADYAEVWGVPTALGDFSVTVTATDATGLATSIVLPLHISELVEDPALPNGTIGLPYSGTLRILGGTGPYTATLNGGINSQQNGVLPAGLTYTQATLTVAGTPIEQAGFNFVPVFSLADSANHTYPVRSNYIFIAGGGSTIDINNGNDLGSITVNSNYSNQLSACCLPEFAWSVVSGNETVPTGLTLSSGGLLSGTVTATGNYTFLVKAVDPNNAANVAFRQFTMSVSPLSLSTPGSLPIGEINTAYSGTLTATGGTGNVTWALNQFTYLPPGLNLAKATGVISGTPTTAGDYFFTVTATDTANNTFVRTFIINVYAGTPPPLNLPLGPSLGSFSVGTLQFQLSAAGGTPPYHFSASPLSTPIAGMRVQDGQPLPTFFPNTITGGYLGVITTPGAYNTSIRVTDSTGATFDRAINFTVSPLNLISQSNPPKALVGSPYSFTLTPTGGSGTYTWTANPNVALPPGITVNSSGQITGTPTVAGAYNISIGLADPAAPGITVFFNESLTVNPFAITDNAILPQGTVNVPYTYTMNAPGCGTNCTWTLPFGGGLPSGLTLSNVGAISGTVTSTSGADASFTIQAAGSNGTVTKVFSLLFPPTVIQGLSITTAIGPATSTVGSITAVALNATGGTPPYSFSLQSGSTPLPTGVTLQGPGETISGTLQPGFQYLAGRFLATGTYPFTIQVTDSAPVPNITTKNFTWVVSRLAFDYTGLPLNYTGNPPYAANPLILNTAYTQPMLVIGGSGSYTSWVTANPIYPGLSASATTGVITGTPTNTGPISTLWTVTDSNGAIASANVNISAASNTTTTIQIFNGPATGAVVPTFGFYFLFPVGGTAPFTFSATALPPGVFLVPNGPNGADLQILPLSPGLLTFTVQVKDANGVTGVHTYSVVVPDFLNTVPGTLPNGSVGVPYSQSLIALGGNSLVWALAPGSTLPPGLSVSAAGVISGTPTAGGNYGFTVTASDPSASGGLSTTVTLNISSLAITGPTPLPIAVTDTTYTAGAPLATMTAAGGAGLTWTATGLPSGMSITSAGLIIGTTSSAGQFNVTLTVTNGVSPMSTEVLLFVRNQNPSELDFPIAGTALQDAEVNFIYSQTLIPTGGVPPYTWTVAAGSTLPPGLILAVLGTDANEVGVAAGTTDLLGRPTTPGPYTFSLTVTDSAGSQITRVFTLNVTPLTLPLIGPVTANSPVVGTPYSQQLIASGGTPPYSFAMTPASLGQDTLPPGLQMTVAGLVFGTPAATGSFTSKLTVTDNAGNTYHSSLTINATAQAPATGLYVSTPDYVSASVGYYLTQQLTVGGGTSTYNWTLNGGALPPGVSIVGSSLSGVPSAPGTYLYDLRATDNANAANFADRFFTIVVSPMKIAAPIATTYLPTGTAGSAYSFKFGVAGGTPPYKFAESPFAPLPPGLTLNPTTGVLAGTPTESGVGLVVPVVTDSASTPNTFVSSNTYKLVIAPAGKVAPLETRPLPLNDASINVPYVAPLDGLGGLTGGTPPYTWTVAPASTLPVGLNITAPTNGVSSYLTGIPTGPTGPASFSLVATDSGNPAQSVTIPFNLNVSPLSVTPDSLAPTVVGTPYSVTFVPDGGTAPYSVNLASFSGLPPGLTFNGGMLSGTPSAPGAYLISMVLSDSASNTLNRYFLLTIDDAAGESPAVSIGPKPINVYYVVGSAPPSVPMTISTTSGSLAFTAMVTGIPGTSLTVTGGNTPGTPTLKFSGPTLTTPGTYLGLAAVSSPGTVNVGDAVPILLTVASPPPCTYSLSPSAATIDAGGGTGSFSISAGPNCAWTATPSDGTVTITSATSGAGNGTVAYSVSSNLGPSATQRTPTIGVAGQTYNITQFGATCSFGINPAVINATSASGSALVSITASDSSCPWTATGLGVTPASGTGSGQVTIQIPQNNNVDPLSSNATIAGQSLTVNQTGGTCTVGLASPGTTMLAAGGTGAVTVNVAVVGGCGYSTVPGPSWISVTSGGAGTATGPLTFTVDANSTTVTRAGTLTIGGNPFTITQQPLACSITTDTSNLGSPFANAGGNGTIAINANGSNCSWTAVSNNPAVATVLPASGTGNGTVTVTTAGGNALLAPITGSVTIGGQTISFTQAGTTCSYALRSAGGTVPASGGSGSVGIVTASACPVAASSDSLSWLTVNSSPSSGSGDIQFTAAANSTAGPQIGHINVQGLVYTVTQPVAPCTFNLPVSSVGTPGSPGVVAGGASTSFNFTLASGGCTTLTPQSYVQWISIGAPNASPINAGTGTVNYTVRPNSGPATRTGNIQVGDQVFTVYQAGNGANCNFSLNSYGAAFGQAGGSANFLASESAAGCVTPTATTSQVSIVPSPPGATGPFNNIFTQPYTVSVFTSANNAVRVATITFGDQIFTVKQTSW